MKKILIGLLALGSISAFAGSNSEVCEANAKNWINENMSEEQKELYAKDVCEDDTNPHVIAPCLQSVWSWLSRNASNRYEIVKVACKGVQYKPVNYESCLSFAFFHVFESEESHTARRVASAAYCNRLNFPPIAIDLSSPRNLDTVTLTRNRYRNNLSNATRGSRRDHQMRRSNGRSLHNALRRSTLRGTERFYDDFLRRLGVSEGARELYRFTR